MLDNLKAIRFSEETLQWLRSYVEISNGFFVHNKNKLKDFG